MPAVPATAAVNHMAGAADEDWAWRTNDDAWRTDNNAWRTDDDRRRTHDDLGCADHDTGSAHDDFVVTSVHLDHFTRPRIDRE